MPKQKAIVIGAGIVGLAMARALAEKGFSVDVFERNFKATGASIRNFGMVFPVSQPSGKLYERAVRSRDIWKEVCTASGAWFDPVGTMHLAYENDEWDVLQEVYEIYKSENRPVELLSPGCVLRKSSVAAAQNLKGGLFSSDEIIVDPRESIATMPEYFSSTYPIRFHWGKCVTYISDQTVYIGNREEYEADILFICSGADFETLYPEHYAQLPVTRCKLQMMRFREEGIQRRIGPALCGGLSLIHYAGFRNAPSLGKLKNRFETEMAEYLHWGIHVMVSQNGKGELTVGDSHEYGLNPDPFDKDFINRMILDYLQTFTSFQNLSLIETWNGIYPKMTNGETDLFFSPEPGVYILNALSGAGMTLGFGLAEEVVTNL